MATASLWCRVTVLGPDGVERARFELRGVGNPDMAVVDTLARLRLAAGRAGGGVVLGALAPELRRLLVLAGLAGEVGGQAEGGEDPLGVEEEAEGGDAPV